MRKPKSNHKHIYEPCLVHSITKYGEHYSYGKYCTICHKAVIINYFEVDRVTHIMLTQKQILEKYKDLPIIMA